MLHLSEYRDHASPAGVLRFGSTVEILCSRIITTLPAVFKLHRDIVVTVLWWSLPFFTLSNESFVLDKGCVLTREDGNMPGGWLRLCLRVVVVYILKTWIQWPSLGKPKWYQITNCCHIMWPLRKQACVMTLLLMESKSDNPFEDWRLSKITHDFLLHGEQSITFNKTIHWIQRREINVVLDENRKKHINTDVWQTAEFVTLQQTVRIVTTWLKSLILVTEVIFIECSAVWCDLVRTTRY